MTPERLAEIEAHAQTHSCLMEAEALELVAALREAQTTLERAREIHRPNKDGYGFCVGCWEGGGEDGAVSWPCPTIRALDGGQAEAIPNNSNSK